MIQTKVFKHNSKPAPLQRSMTLKKVLILESERSMQDLYEVQLKGSVALIKAFSLEEAYEKFNLNQDVAMICLSSLILSEEVPKIIPTIRRSFGGLIIGGSTMTGLRNDLIDLGCDYVCDKGKVAKNIIKILKL